MIRNTRLSIFLLVPGSTKDEKKSFVCWWDRTQALTKAQPMTAIVLLDLHPGSLLVGQGKKRDQKLKYKYFSDNNKRPSFLFESIS